MGEGRNKKIRDEGKLNYSYIHYKYSPRPKDIQGIRFFIIVIYYSMNPPPIKPKIMTDFFGNKQSGQKLNFPITNFLGVLYK